MNRGKYRCDYNGCGKTFTCPHALVIHRRSHTGEKPFKCDGDGGNCAASFSSKNGLTSHKLNVHSNRRTFTCDADNCGKSFKSNARLRAHRGVHSAEKRYSHNKKQLIMSQLLVLSLLGLCALAIVTADEGGHHKGGHGGGGRGKGGHGMMNPLMGTGMAMELMQLGKDSENICTDANMVDTKLDTFREETAKCGAANDDCDKEAEDVTSKVTKVENKKVVKFLCSKKYTECQKKKMEEMKKLWQAHKKGGDGDEEGGEGEAAEGAEEAKKMKAEWQKKKKAYKCTDLNSTVIQMKGSPLMPVPCLINL
ncbi:unnamed protein product [Oppiella nova]|uniref:C2H2-type domain-containing protein n=1 Tax=Oppiella nova TaxID=334625 RepID=A0A7R9M264_9ACAR|nr:unnamed protein product [Oppiella nova]CAG2169398.1 unnamed protein product [Oppiella nova]